jgi:hypothetical protein
MEANPWLQDLRRVGDEAERRVSRSVAVPQYDYTPSARESNLNLVHPGTITLFLGRPGSELLQEIRACIRSGVADGTDARLAQRLADISVDRPTLAFPVAIDLLLAQDVISELTFNGTTLVANAFVPDDLDVAVFPLPYSGGPIDPDGFRLINRSADGLGWLDGFLAIHRPNLTAAEAAALAMVPRDAVSVNVGRHANCYAVTAVAVVAVVALGTYACPGSFAEVHLDPDLVRRIGPEGTARELVRLRRQALEQG